jgi:PKD repeat protein
VTTSPLLAAPNTPITISYNPWSATIPNPETAISGFNVNNYKLLQGSPVRNKAATSYPFNGQTPPAVTLDNHFMGGTSRGTSKDLGAHEYDGAVVDPGDTLTVSFTQSATNGQVPLTVNFVDTSVSSGTKTAWAWEFGNGATSTTQNPTYIYSTPGTYTPRLTVTDSNGLQVTKTGSTITVIPADNPGSSGGGVSVARTTVSTSTGEQTIEVGTNTPLALLFILSGAPTVGTVADNAHLCIGVWSEAGQYAQVIGSPDNLADTDSRSGHINGKVIARHSTADGYIGQAAVTAVAAGSVTLNYTSAFAAAYQLTVVAFEGSGAEAVAAAPTAGVAGSALAVPGGDLALMWSAYGTTEAYAQMSLGAAAGGSEVYHAWRDQGNLPTSNVNAWTGGGYIANYLSANGTRAYVDPVSVSAGTAVVVNNAIGAPVAALGIRGMGAVKVGQFLGPGSSGSVSYDAGFEPTFVMLWGGLVPGIGGGQANANPGNNAFWVAVVTGDGTYYTGLAVADDAATTNTISNAENSIKVYDGGGTLRLAGAVTLDSDGFDVNWTARGGC